MVAKRTKKRLFIEEIRNIAYKDFHDNNLLGKNEEYYGYSPTGSIVHIYYDSFDEWCRRIIKSDFSIGFGLCIYYGDLYKSICCTEREIDNSLKRHVMYKFSSIIKDYFDDNLDYYYKLTRKGKYLLTELTGHTYYKSLDRNSDSCSTCDGIKCDICKKKYTVTDFYSNRIFYEGYDLEEASKELATGQEHFADIINDILERYKSELDMDWFEKEIGNNDSLECVLKLIRKFDILFNPY